LKLDSLSGLPAFRRSSYREFQLAETGDCCAKSEDAANPINRHEQLTAIFLRRQV
jgi:hypothetical protein